jgi:hypothetical protein
MTICIDSYRIVDVMCSEKFSRYMQAGCEGLSLGEHRAFAWYYTVDYEDNYGRLRQTFIDVYTIIHPKRPDQNFNTKEDVIRAMLMICNDMRRWVCKNDPYTYMTADEYGAWELAQPVGGE